MRCASNIADFGEGGGDAKAECIAALRLAVEGLQSVPVGISSEPVSADVEASLDPGLPGPGLVCGVLNEVIAAHADRPAAFGFLFALTAAALRTRAGPAVFVASRRSLAEFGAPYGHGLRQLGLDVGQLILVETKTDKDALWALEETLRSQARPAVVAGAVEGGLDLTPSRRLNLAAAVHRTPLLLLRGAKATGTSAAATRWRIAAAPVCRDRFGAFERWRWHVALERCRSGRPGKWLIEWNHVAHRFRLVEGLADRPLAQVSVFRRAG